MKIRLGPWSFVLIGAAVRDESGRLVEEMLAHDLAVRPRVERHLLHLHASPRRLGSHVEGVVHGELVIADEGAISFG